MHHLCTPLLLACFPKSKIRKHLGRCQMNVWVHQELSSRWALLPQGASHLGFVPSSVPPGCVVGKQFLLFPVVSSPTLSWRKEGRACMPWPPSPPRPGQEGLTQTPCTQSRICLFPGHCLRPCPMPGPAAGTGRAPEAAGPRVSLVRTCAMFCFCATLHRAQGPRRARCAPWCPGQYPTAFSGKREGKEQAPSCASFVFWSQNVNTIFYVTFFVVTTKRNILIR